MKTHDNETISALSALELRDIEQFIWDVDIIAVDEGHFFPDLVPFCESQANLGKQVIVAALDGDHARKPYQNVSELVSKADTFKKLDAICFFCQRRASFTCLVDSSVGDPHTRRGYAACCRRCWRDRGLSER